jgi:hypothetical protein
MEDRSKKTSSTPLIEKIFDRIFITFKFILIGMIPLIAGIILAGQVYWWLMDAVWYSVSNKTAICFTLDICKEIIFETKMKGLDLILNYILDMSFSISILILFFIFINS